MSLKRSFFTILLSAGVTSAAAHAAFTPEKLMEATKASVDNLRATSPAHFPHLVGYRTYKSEDDAKTTIYVDHDGMPMEFEYLCKDGAPVTCTLQ